MVVTDDEIIRTHPVHKIFPGIQFVDQRIEIEFLEIFARRLFAANAADQARKRLAPAALRGGERAALAGIDLQARQYFDNSAQNEIIECPRAHIGIILRGGRVPLIRMGTAVGRWSGEKGKNMEKESF